MQKQKKTIGDKLYSDINVLDAGKQRLKDLYSYYDKVIVNFSGGKDSTALLYLTIEVATELNKLPVEVLYVDHEIEGEGTFKLIEEVSKMPEVKMNRYCIPMALRNACSMYAPEWYPWNPLEKHLWIMDIPEGAISDLNELEGYVFEVDENYKHPDGSPFYANAVKRCSSFGDICDLFNLKFQRQGLNTISLNGVRAEESLARFSVMSRKQNECYISSNGSIAYPIYDWGATDVWKYIRETGKPYNIEYDKMNQTKYGYNKLKKQRVGSIFAEESLRTLDNWQELYKEYWHKIIERAEGVKTAWRYCNDSIYTGTRIEKENNVSFEDYAKNLLSKMSPETKAITIKSLNKIITWHKNQTDYPIADREKDACPLTGISWEFLARICIRGDSKDRNLQKVTMLSLKARQRNNITRDEAVDKYGKEEYKKRYYAKRV